MSLFAMTEREQRMESSNKNNPAAHWHHDMDKIVQDNIGLIYLVHNIYSS